MRTIKKSLAAALSAVMILTLAPIGGFDTASAQPIIRRPPPGGPGPGFRPGGPGPGARRPGNNAAAGAAFGILAGALIGSAIQAQQQQQYRQHYYSDGIAWCASRYRSYDPYSQTYRGYDGRRYRCP